MKATDNPVVIEQVFNTSARQLWEALTNLEKMKFWFFDNMKTFVPEVGFETQFAVHVEERTFTHLWKITEVIPFKKITYNWKYEEYPGDSFVTFEIIEEENRVRLILTMKIVEDFPDDIPEFTRESCLGGWNYFLKENLYNYFNSQTR